MHTVNPNNFTATGLATQEQKVANTACDYQIPSNKDLIGSDASRVMLILSFSMLFVLSLNKLCYITMGGSREEDSIKIRFLIRFRSEMHK